MKKFTLLALLAIALVMPIVVNAAAISSTTVYADATSAGTLVGGSGTNANTASTAFLVADQGGFNSTFRGLTGTGVTNSFFSVVANTPLFSATMNSNVFSTGMTPTLIDLTTGQTIPLAIDPTTGMYTFGSLVSGQVYDIQIAYSIAAATTAAVYTTITVAAIPEPEQWAMMIVGLFLVAAKISKTKKSANVLSPLPA